MSEALLAELQASCNAIGGWSKTGYKKSDDCIGALTDILRCLLYDNEEFEARRYILGAKIIQRDLVPILETFPDLDLIRLTLRLLANLTMRSAPITTIEPIEDSSIPAWIVAQIDSCLYSAKQAFGSELLFQVLSDRCKQILSTPMVDRTDEDSVELTRIMMTINNVLSIGSTVNPESETIRVHDQVVSAIQSTDFEAIILFMANSKLTVEVISSVKLIWLMLKYQLPDRLSRLEPTSDISKQQKQEINNLTRYCQIAARYANIFLSITLKKTSLCICRNSLSSVFRDLDGLLNMESNVDQKSKIFSQRRFSKYSGTFVVKDCAALGGRDVILHQPVSNVKDIRSNNAFNNRKFRIPKNKAPLKLNDLSDRAVLSSDYKVSIRLKDMCDEFLKRYFNHAIRRYKTAFGQHFLPPSDEPFLFNIISFVLSFATSSNRLSQQLITHISEAIEVNSFHFNQVNLQRYMELFSTNKANGTIHCHRMHAAIACLKRMLITITQMLEFSDEEIRAAGKTIACNVLYVQEYREEILFLLRNFDVNKMSTAMLRDCVYKLPFSEKGTHKP
ncbi:hypothetical protein ACOME3_008068 [Neoechinorhynchus agilis]